MRTVLAILAVFAAIAAVIGLFILEVWMVVWNATDIYNNGLNFWNTFWLMLVAGSFVGAARAVR